MAELRVACRLVTGANSEGLVRGAIIQERSLDLLEDAARDKSVGPFTDVKGVGDQCC